MKRILVTAATGNIGAEVTPAGAVLQTVSGPTRANIFLLFKSKTQLVPNRREVADLRQWGDFKPDFPSKNKPNLYYF